MRSAYIFIAIILVSAIPASSTQCADAGKYCDVLKKYCNDEKYEALTRKECAKTCGHCKVIDKTEY
uniref:ShKT domain-containing protein n=1 Tax=Ascaris lumbricoides TaxID=6252 RepID=A0A0M3II34_ASCLU